jgi:hypothetical protein
VDPQQLLLQPGARDRIEGTEGLVHQHHGRVGGKGAREADTLALAAGDLRGVAGAVVPRGQVDEVEQLVHAGSDLGLRPAEQTRNRADVLRDRHVREEPDLLDHIPDPAAELGLVERLDALPADLDVTGRQLDEAVHQLHRCRLAAAGRPHEAADLARGDRQRKVVDRRRRAAGVELGRVVEDDLDRLTPAPHSA